MTPEDADPADRPQDPIVERLRPDPAKPPVPTRTQTGFFGDSDRPGFKRLYLTRAVDSYAEFRAEDLIDVASIPPDEAPFAGEQATRVTLRGDAEVEFTRRSSPSVGDEFDLDVRFGRRTAFDEGVVPHTNCDAQTCQGQFTCQVTCTCETCRNTCTCNTQCDQDTCRETCTCPVRQTETGSPCPATFDKTCPPCIEPG